MDIKLGTQLCVYQAYKCLTPDTRYYYLGPSNPTTAALLFFYDDAQYWRVASISIPRPEFETILAPETQILCRSPTQLTRPEWMASHQTANFSELEDLRYKKARLAHADRVAAKLGKLSRALEDRHHILASREPVKALHRYAKDAGSHPYRFAVDFYAYILHGCDRWALMARWFSNGQWDREEKGKKFGRVALARDYCFVFPMTRAMRMRILSFARRSKNKFETFRNFHEALIRMEFRCVVITLKSGRKVLSRENEPFPSEGQAYRAVTEALTKDEFSALFGREKGIRLRRPFNLGNYTGQFASNLEAIEADGYVIVEVLRSFISDRPTTKMIVVRIICTPTAAVVGVGFSIGGETKEAYRAAFYSMIAPRRYLERLYGLGEGSLDRWVTGGLSGYSTVDRGPAGWGVVADAMDQQWPLKQMAPTEEPRSKAAAEASHPRHRNVSDDKTYRESDLTVAGVMKRELLRAVHDNETSSIEARLSDAMKAEFYHRELPATPNGLWEYNRMKGRNAGDSSMGEHEAIRTFWTPVQVKLCVDGIDHGGSSYTSQKLIDSGVLYRLAYGQQIELTAYTLPCAVRFLHVEVGGELIEVERILRLRVGQEDNASSEEDRAEAKKFAARLRAEQRMAAKVAAVELNGAAVEQTGESLHGARTRRGRKALGRSTATDEQAAIKGQSRSNAA